jgi:hypothetical protein
MKTNTAMLADVKLVLSAPVHVQTKRHGYRKTEIDFVSARTQFIDRAASTTWTGTVETARRLHAEAERVRLAHADRELETAASRAYTDEGGEA